MGADPRKCFQVHRWMLSDTAELADYGVVPLPRRPQPLKCQRVHRTARDDASVARPML